MQNIGRVGDIQSRDFNFDNFTPQTTSVGGGLPGINYGPSYRGGSTTPQAPQTWPQQSNPTQNYVPTGKGEPRPEVLYGPEGKGATGKGEPRPEVFYGPDGPPVGANSVGRPAQASVGPAPGGYEREGRGAQDTSRVLTGFGDQGRAGSMPFGVNGRAATMGLGQEGRAGSLYQGSQGRASSINYGAQERASALARGAEGRASALAMGTEGRASALARGAEGRASALNLMAQGRAGSMPFGVSGGPQRDLNYGGLTSLPGANDFGAEGRRMSDSVYNQYTSRLNPQFEQSRDDTAARLAAQGISNNSDAYRREIDNLGRTQNDAYQQAAYQAQQAGAGEQSRLFGLAMGARQQGQNEINTQGTFANQAQDQDFGQQVQTYGQQNAAQQQNFGQAYQAAEQANAAQNQNFGQAFQTQDQANQAQNQNFGQAYQTVAQQNEAQNQNFGQAYQTVAQQNAAQGQNFGQEVEAFNQANQAQNQNFGQAYQTVDQQNAAQNQNFGQALQTYGQQNAAQNQNFGQAVQTYGQQNQAQEQNYQQAMGIADFFNNAQSQAFNQDIAGAGFQNAARSQAFNEQSSNAALANSARQQQISEASYLRNLPLNEIAALMGTAGGVSDPNFSPVAQVGVAAPDYQGMVQNNFNTANARYNQQQASRSQAMGSLAGLAGNAASMFMMSDRRLKYDIRRVGNLANGLATYAFKYIGSKAQQFGVMAQEVLKVRPDAVGVAPNGYLFVDYAKVL